jgi:cysteinyl-tRNA synthetase
MGRAVQEFVPRAQGAVQLYSCGPTVYDYATIGNFRTFIFVDVLRRTLAALGYEVRHMMNITDVGHLASDADEGEDKMLAGARREGTTVWEIAAVFTERFFADAAALNILRPHVVAKATEHVADMIALIRRLEERGFTYEAGGNVFFDVARFARYSELALLDRQRLQAGARISVDQSKRNPEDFGLWFTRSKFENQAMIWDSPWGRGYPGWHIECSAMAMRYLQERFDIHCGGIDLIPVHHTNEIAQAEAALGIDPQSSERWVNYWCHGEFLMVNGAKMSKSKGNWVTLGQLQKQGYDALDFRFFVLGAHYRAHQNFTMRALAAARVARLGLIARLAELGRRAAGADLRALRPADSSHPAVREALTHAANDLAMPRVLACLWHLVKGDEGDPEHSLRAVAAIDGILGLELLQAAATVAEGVEQADPAVDALVREREAARRRRDFDRADAIRAELTERGIELRDTPTGTVWHRPSVATPVAE